MKWILVYGVFVHWIPDDMGTYFPDMTLLTMAYDNLFSKEFIAILFSVYRIPILSVTFLKDTQGNAFLVKYKKVLKFFLFSQVFIKFH